jgi:thiamine-monophosphate kinase
MADINSGDQAVLGEAGIIAAFMAPLAAGFPGALDLKDDCALLSPPPGEEIVLKTDAVAEGIHFRAADDPADIGWKALAVNVSDLSAKGARPLVYLMSLSFREAPRRDWLARFTTGLAEAQAAFGIHLAGGDTDRRPGPLSVTITVLGAVAQGRMVRRATARPGDRIVVSGTLGDSALGLRLLEMPDTAQSWALSASEAAHLTGRYLRPQPRLGLRTALLDHARAAMDLSDGLLKDLGRMCLASGVSAVVEAGRLPMSASARKAMAADPSLIQSVAAAGDDYEVLATVEPANLAAYIAAAEAGGVAVTEIGTIGTGQGVRLTDANGRDLPLASLGWDHFG